MSAKILDGKKRAEEIKETIKQEIESLKAAYNQAPKLTVLQIGEAAVSSIYIKSQKRAAEEVGIEYELVNIDPTQTEDEVISTIKDLNSDHKVTGIIIQLPMPEKLDRGKIYSSISPLKDAEGLHPENLGRLFYKDYRVGPSTPSAIMELIKLSRVDLYGKEVVIIGHSEIVGKPLSILLLNEFATVSVCHIATSKSGNLTAHVNRAEILIVAVGKPNLIKGQWIKEGAVVIDVGINRVGDKIVGDVEFESAKERASFITPVPGGVGPLTTAMLMRNCLALFKKVVPGTTFQEA